MVGIRGAGREEGGQVKAARLARAGRHHHQHILAAHRRVDGAQLQRLHLAERLREVLALAHRLRLPPRQLRPDARLSFLRSSSHTSRHIKLRVLNVTRIGLMEIHPWIEITHAF